MKNPNKTFKQFFLILFTCFLAISITSSTHRFQKDDSDAIVGVWKTGEGNAMVRIYKNGEKFQGKIVWLKEPIDPETGKPKLDKNHPEESARTRPILGLVNIWGFTNTGKNLWEEGNIYDPKNGNTYSCSIKMINSKVLEVRGFIGVSLLGRTDTWTRQVAKN
ncbi:MAG: DUF2147 domain-containing protein [Bacteroidetes bacterium]|nr:DUF2147 domain-containing protein [Bacteroidota bacterium]